MEVFVDCETRWKCLHCGKCCREIGLGLESSKLGFDKKSGTCSKFKDDSCSDYPNRPLICMMYPFHPSRENLALGRVDFGIGKLLIDSACSGFGHGSRVVENEPLTKEFEKVASILQRRMDLIKDRRIVEAFF